MGRLVPGLVDLRGRAAAYFGCRVGAGPRCCWPASTDPFGAEDWDREEVRVVGLI